MQVYWATTSDRLIPQLLQVCKEETFHFIFPKNPALVIAQIVFFGILNVSKLFLANLFHENAVNMSELRTFLPRQLPLLTLCCPTTVLFNYLFSF